MQEIKKEKYRGSVLLKISLVCLAGFLVLMLIGQQIQISAKTEELAQLQEQVKTQIIDNEELKDTLDDDEKMRQYYEEVARKEYNYARPEEKIFINAGGAE